MYLLYISIQLSFKFTIKIYGIQYEFHKLICEFEHEMYVHIRDM
jgi:hypothetical protein